jgi:hypothetical protein
MDRNIARKPQPTAPEPEHLDSRGDLENERAQQQDRIREKTLDKTLADSFPTSDPPSSIPDPVAAHTPDQSQAALDTLVANLPPGSWAVISEDQTRVLGTGASREEAVSNAGGESDRMRVLPVPQDPDAPEQAA